MIIDIHTHIYNEEHYKAYFNKAGNKVSKVLVMGYCKLYWEDNIGQHEYNFKKILEFIEKKNNIYMTGSVNVEGDIKEQLEILDELFQEKKIYGVKLYPGYQYFYPSDEKIYPIAELCQKYNKPLIFHSGDVYNPEGDAILKYSHPIHIDELAVKYQKCKIIISHFGFPYHLETANVVSKNDNVYTDVSGTLDEANTKKEAENLLTQYIKDLTRVFNYFPDVKSKTMFGTDYGGEETPLRSIDPYIKVVDGIFSKKEQESVFYKLADKLFFK